jgi:predicted metal-binding membrane protein
MGVLVVAAGIYELTPLKQAALRRSRVRHDGETPLGGGLAHGVDCVVCSGAPMAPRRCWLRGGGSHAVWQSRS